MTTVYNILKSLKYSLTSIRHRLHGNCLGKDAMVSGKATLRKSTIGKYSYVAENSSLNCVDMGNYCSIGPSVLIGSMEHPYWMPSTSPRLYGEECKSEIRTVIGHDVWIGAQSFIRQGVRIGNGAVIGAHSFVNKDVPSYSIVFGTPAKVHKMRFDPEIVSAIEKTNYFDFPPDKARELLSAVCEMLDDKRKGNENR